MERFLMWSGGKDSTASIIICHEKGIKLDGVIFSEVMFDHKRGISGENPDFIKWMYDLAIPKIREMGYSVIALRSEKDYISVFNKTIRRGKRQGKKYGFPIGGRCWANSRLKFCHVSAFLKSHPDCEQIVGIAADETERYGRAKARGKRSVLCEYGIKEEQTYDICRKYGLLSPTYEHSTRGGCWFCPNQSIKELARLRSNHPGLWNELVELSHTPNLCSYGFKYGKTVQEVEKEMDAHDALVEYEKSQLSFFD